MISRRRSLGSAARVLALLAIGLCCAVAGTSAFAANATNTGNKVVSPTGQPITLEVSKGRLIQLSQPANSVFVADPDVADVQVKSPSLIYLFGKAAGETTLYAVGDNDDVVLNAMVHVQHDISALQRAIHDLVPRSTVHVATVDDSLVLEGTVYSSADADDIRRIAARYVPDPKELVNKMQVDAPNQVNIRVRVAEVNRNITKELGINWNALFNDGHIMFSLITSPLEAAGATANTVSFGGQNKNLNVSSVIDALEQNGLVTILAEPNLTAISGEPASFLAGGEFPVPAPQTTGTGQIPVITVDYKKFGVSLNFVATIHGDRINLHVAPEVSELSTQGAIEISGIQVPALTTRRADTTLELASGQSFAIGGLLQNNITQTLQKFPWLGDVPILGTLFRSNTYQRDESELVIIVTPYIVRPVSSPSALRAPTDAFISPSDQAQFLNGDIYRPQLRQQTPAPVSRDGTSLVGPAGFELE